ncbi:atp-binding cassette transporter, partial [Schistosoma japonicum]
KIKTIFIKRVNTCYYFYNKCWYFCSRISSLEADYTLDTLRAKWWASNTRHCDTLSIDEGYDFEEVGGMFTLLVCGLVIGGVLLISEIVIFHILLKRQQTKVLNESSRLPQEAPISSAPETIQEEEESTNNLSTRNPIVSTSITITTTDYSDPDHELKIINE